MPWLKITNTDTNQVIGWLNLEVVPHPDVALTEVERQLLAGIGNDIGFYARDRIYWDEVPARLDFWEDK